MEWCIALKKTLFFTFDRQKYLAGIKILVDGWSLIPPHKPGSKNVKLVFLLTALAFTACFNFPMHIC